MNRRSFLGRGGLAASAFSFASVTGCAPRARSAQCDSPRPPGVQLFTVRESLQVDAARALAALAEIGLREVELFGLGGSGGSVFGMQATQFKETLDRNELSAPVSHVGGNFENTAETAELAHAIGTHTLVLAIAPQFMSFTDGGGARMVGPDTLAQVDRLAEHLNEVGGRFREHGLAFGYHNHHVELFPVEGQIPLDRLMSRTDPDLVKLELDIGWLAAAGRNPIDYLQRYAGRVVACHLKDFDGRNPLPRGGVNDLAAYHERLVAPGGGTVDFARVLGVMDDTGVGHGFIEIDVADDPLAAVTSGHEHLRRLPGGC